MRSYFKNQEELCLHTQVTNAKHYSRLLWSYTWVILKKIDSFCAGSYVKEPSSLSTFPWGVC